MIADAWIKRYRRIQKRTPRQRAAWQKTPRCWAHRMELPSWDPVLDVATLAGAIAGLGAMCRAKGEVEG